MTQQMKKIRTLKQQFHHAEDGVTMIEFAFAFPIFLIFFLGVVEIAMITFGNAAIENSMNQASRQGMVGCERNEFNSGVCVSDYTVTPEKLRQEIVQKSAGLVDACDPNKFFLTVQPYTGPLGAPTSYPSGTIDLGQGDEVVVYRAVYRWPIFNPVLKVQGIFGDSMDYVYTTVVRNERFGFIGSQRVMASGGGC